MGNWGKPIALVVVLCALVVGALVLFVRTIQKSFTDSVIYKAAVVKARIDARVEAEIGSPAEADSPSGSRTSSGGHSSATLRFSLTGPLGKADVELEGESSGDSVRFSRLDATLPSGKRVDLLKPTAPSIIRASDDCRYSHECERDGLCREERHKCWVGTLDDCQSSSNCKKEGRCHPENGECRPVTDTHCQDSEDCETSQRCVLDKGRCVAPVADCKSSDACVDSGLCSKEGEKCVAASDEDCASSRECRTNGKCIARNGACEGELRSDGQVTLGKPLVHGELAGDAVERGLAGLDAVWLACYRSPKAAAGLRGSVNVRFVIGRDGAVSNVSNGGSTLPDSGVVGCAISAVYRLAFQAPESGIVTVVVNGRFGP
jgi:hypothetical protein